MQDRFRQRLLSTPLPSGHEYLPTWVVPISLRPRTPRALAARLPCPFPDHCAVHIIHAEFARQRSLGHSGHADHVAPVALQTIDLGSGFEAWPLRGRIRTAVERVDSGTSRRLEQPGAQSTTVGRCEVDVYHVIEVVLEERVRSTPRVVDNLIGNHDCTAVEVAADPPNRRDGDDPAHPRAVQSPDVGAIVDSMGSDDVGCAVAGEEHDFDALQPAVAQRRGGFAPWCLE